MMKHPLIQLLTVLFILNLLLSFCTGQTYSPDTQNLIFKARDQVLPALVHIEPVRTIFSTGERRHTLVTGSGFIFSEEGYILTNHHVVENAERVSCTLSNKKKISASIIGGDPYTDVAVLKLNSEEWAGNPLPFVALGNSDSLEVGQYVLALGSPLGLSRSVSMGVVSSIDRYFEDRGSMVSPYNLWIQTDAAINPGNSGGPLINLEGKVVGINARGVFLAENLGFAIPINLAREVAQKLIQGTTIQRSWLGLELQSIKEFREYVGQADLHGVLVAHIYPYSPAKSAGILPGDIITSINGIQIDATFEEDMPAIRKIVAELPTTQSTELQIWRQGKIKKLTITSQLEPFVYQPEFECEEWGVVVKSISKQIFQIQGLTDFDGVYISAVKNGEVAERAGLRAGDVIRTVNKQKISDMEHYKTLYQKTIKEKHAYIFIEVIRQSTIFFAAIDVKKSRN